MNERRRNGNRFKLIAVISMVCDHMAFAFLTPWIMRDTGSGADAAGLPSAAAMLLLWFARGLRTFGRMAFPLFAFLLAEGAFYTRDWKNYAARLAVFAAVSEVPFDWMSVNLEGGCDPALWLRSQNVMFTLLLGLFMVRGLIWMQSRGLSGSEAEKPAQLIWVSLWAAFAWLIRCDYGAYGLVQIGIFALFRWEPRCACVLGFLWMGVTCAGLRCWYYWFGYAAAFALLARYGGTRGQVRPAGEKAPSGITAWFRRCAWYWVYPVHLMVLDLIRWKFLP